MMSSAHRSVPNLTDRDCSRPQSWVRIHGLRLWRLKASRFFEAACTDAGSVWNCILMNLIVLVTLTQIGTTKCERQIQCSQCDAALVGRIRLLLLWGLSTRPVRGSKMRDAVRCACRWVLIASESSPLTFMDYFMDYTTCPQTLGTGHMGWATHLPNSLCAFTSLQVFPRAVFDFGYFTAAY